MDMSSGNDQLTTSQHKIQSHEHHVLSTPRSETDGSYLQLLNLPNEILNHIFHFLDHPPPSVQKSLSNPDHNLTRSKHQPLKHISLTNTRLRSVVLPLLFRHARLDPYQLTPFLTFTTTSDTARHITTLTAQLQGPCNHIHPAWWTTLLTHLHHLSTLTILAAPHIFAELSQTPIETSHSWAFKFHYHTLTLTLTLTLPRPSAPSPSTLLLTSHPWTHLSYNESSHLPAYSTYEYFLKTPPSLLPSLRPHTSFLTTVLSFNYIAIYPFYNHIDEVLKTVRLMTNLRKLFTKLCPEPSSNIFQDEIDRNDNAAGRTEGRIDVRDPWNEFETAYMLIPHTVLYLTRSGRLEEFQTDDVKMVGVRDSLVLDISLRLGVSGCWSYVGEGVWRRDMGVGGKS